MLHSHRNRHAIGRHAWVEQKTAAKPCPALLASRPACLAAPLPTTTAEPIVTMNFTILHSTIDHSVALIDTASKRDIVLNWCTIACRKAAAACMRCPLPTSSRAPWWALSGAVVGAFGAVVGAFGAVTTVDTADHTIQRCSQRRLARSTVSVLSIDLWIIGERASNIP